MDLNDVRQTIQQHERGIQRLSEELGARNAQKELSMLNFNQQYSQKCKTVQN